MARRGASDGLNGDLPVDVMPYSNGEFVPRPPSADQIDIMRLADEETERARGRFAMSRRDFVRTAAAFAIGLWSIDAVTGGRLGRYAVADVTGTSPNLCDLEYPGAQLSNLPGEFIFDVQGHHVESDGLWRVLRPTANVTLGVLFDQAGPFGGLPGLREDGSVHGTGRGGEIDPIESLSRPHFIKELLLDSSTNMVVLSAVPAAPDIQQPLPIARAAETVRTVRALAGGTDRAVMHAFAMPNRGWTKQARGRPLYFDQEMEALEARAIQYRDIVRGWKCYTPFGDLPGASGWLHTDDYAYEFQQHVLFMSQKYGVPPVIATHKGPGLPGFDNASNTCGDLGRAARDFPGIKWVVYHAGFRVTRLDYPGDAEVPDTEVSVDNLIKALRVNGLDAGSHVPTGLQHGNSPNVWAEIGSTWKTYMSSLDYAAALLGKLITHVGPRRILWGTDALWGGSPQPEIVALRAFEFTNEGRAKYNLPYGLDGDRFDPTRNAMDAASYASAHPHVTGWPTDGRAHPERTIRNGIFGRNAAEVYGVDPDATRAAIACDEVQKLRDRYLVNQMTPREGAPLRSNQIFGPRTPRDLYRMKREEPWGP